MIQRYFFHFGSPYFLILLLLVPFIFFIYYRSYGQAKIRFSSLKLFSSFKKSRKESFKFILPLLRGLSLVFLIIALARPQLGTKSTEVLSEGVDILLTIDTSGSMKALDFHLKGSEVNRLDVVKNVVSDFIERRDYDRMGMIIFGEEAYTQCPLTLDHNILLSFLQWIRIGIIGDGTAIGNALAVSVKRLKDQPTKSKVIILLTDGRNNAGEVDPITAAQIAKKYGIKVYTIGVGSRGPVPYPEETPFGVRQVLARLDLDEDTLKQIADITFGRYFRATETDELEEIYQTIDQLEKTEIKMKEYNDYHELYMWFVIIGLVLMILEIGLSHTIFMRIP